MSEQVKPVLPTFKVGEFYTGKCTEVNVVQMGDSQAMQYGFSIPDGDGEFVQFTRCFLGSGKQGKDGKTNDDRVKEDLIAFGCKPEWLESGNIMAYIRSVLIGKTIEVQAEEYKGAIQFAGCRPPGARRGPNIVITENPFGSKGKPIQAGGAGVF